MSNMKDIIKNINTTEFITAVKNENAIWNTQSAEYCDKVAKNNAWDRVMTKFIEDYSEKSDAEKLNIAMMFQRKWKSLRNSYTRELLRKKQETTSGSKPTPRREYLYFNNLNFLSTLGKPTASNIEDDEDDEDREEVAYAELEEEIPMNRLQVRATEKLNFVRKNSNQEEYRSRIKKGTEEIAYTESEEEMQMNTLPVRPMKKFKSVKKSSNQEEYRSRIKKEAEKIARAEFEEEIQVRPMKIFNSVERSNNQEGVLLSVMKKFMETINKPDSSDKLFMLSLVPELEQLPDEIKFDVKADILNVFKRTKQSSSSKQIHNSESSIPSQTFSHAESTITSGSPQQFPSLSITVSTQTSMDSDIEFS